MSLARSRRHPLTTCLTETNTAHPIDIATPHRLDVPESQESVYSTISSTFSAPARASTSSSPSSDQDVASPSKPNGQAGHSRLIYEPVPASPSRIHGQVARPDAPRVDTAAANAPQTGRTTATSMSLTSPTTQGFKRSADGSVKSDGVSTSPTERIFTHKRNKSTDTHSSARIGEVRDSRPKYDPYAANLYAAIRSAQNAPLVCDGQGAEWLGEAVARGTGRSSLATRIAQLSTRRLSSHIRLTLYHRLSAKAKRHF